VKRLVDTHIAIWIVNDDPKLPKAVRDLILANKDSFYVSAASVWEIAIKFAIRANRKHDIPFSGQDALSGFIESGLFLLDIQPEHAAKVDSLPMHHGDPFDRLLIAQAIVERMQFVTHDKKLAAYGESVLLV
jgi:PIN domain nuclease of toxin-antitoxin system